MMISIVTRAVFQGTSLRQGCEAETNFQFNHISENQKRCSRYKLNAFEAAATTLLLEGFAVVVMQTFCTSNGSADLPTEQHLLPT
jgi:hypothetical protein